MLIVDDILLFPARSILWIFHEIHNASQEELAHESESITAELSELYMMLETGRITESEFETQEKELLDRLDKLQDQEIRIKDNVEDEDIDYEKNVFMEVVNRV